MQSILIVEPSEELRTELAKELQKRYRIFCCNDGDEGLLILKKHRPDGLIVNLFLHGTDGLRFLEVMDAPRPKAIIALSYAYPSYMHQVLKDLGVNYWLLLPCTIHAITYRIHDILQNLNLAAPEDAQGIISEHLYRMGIPAWNGYQMLRVGVPLFAQDRTQLLSKDLYPAIAILCNCDNWLQVEKSIRDAIHFAWEHRNEEIWREYFSDISVCPTNKEFISRLSDFLDRQENKDVSKTN